MRAFLIMFLSVLLTGSATTKAAYRPTPPATHAHAMAAYAADVSRHQTVSKPSRTRAERRVQQLLHRILRLLPEEGEGKIDTNSLLSFAFGVASLIGIFVFPYLAILAVPALILGIIGLGKTGPDGLRGRGLAIAGTVTGALTLLLGILAAILVVLFLIAIF